MLNIYRFLRKLIFFLQRTIFITFEGEQIAIPSRHSLIKLQLQEPLRHQSLKIASKYFLNEAKNHVVDVGANIGDTAIVIKAGAKCEIFFTLVEPSQFYLKFLNLNSNLIQNCEIIDCYVSPNFQLSEISSEIVHWGGTAHLVKSKSKKIEISEQVLLHELAKPNTGLIKIDCDGPDLDILTYFLKKTKTRPVIYYENTINDTKDLLKSLSVIELAQLKDYGFISVFSNDGLLLWSGDINKKALKDIFQYQLNLSHLGLKRRLPYTDILLVPIVDRSNFNKFEKEFRNLQENHASSKIISGNSNELG